MSESSPMSFPMSFGTFLSIDFETANAKRVSACSLGIAKVVDGTISEHRAYLIKPVGEYSPFNIKVHGITPDMTKDAPTFDKLFPLIRDDFENLPILCYSDLIAASSTHCGFIMSWR